MAAIPTRTVLDQAEGPRFDRKSLRTVTGSTADFPELAKDCVAFANASGGNIILGCEDKAYAPPPQQRIEAALPERIRKRIGELTAGVHLSLEVLAHDNGGQYIDVTVLRANGVASTSDGRYFLRIGDASEPVVGGDIVRLIDERPGTPWELLKTNAVRRTAGDPAKVAALVGGLRRSVDRVKEAVKLKSDAELLSHYSLASGDELTNLGVLLVGTAADRARLGTAPVVQAIQYDEQRQKVWKHAWDDYALSPIELVDAVWSGVPAFRESYEVPDGLLRTSVPAPTAVTCS